MILFGTASAVTPSYSFGVCTLLKPYTRLPASFTHRDPLLEIMQHYPTWVAISGKHVSNGLANGVSMDQYK